LFDRPVITRERTTKYDTRKVQNQPISERELSRLSPAVRRQLVRQMKKWDGKGYWQLDKDYHRMSEAPITTGAPKFLALGPMEYLVDPQAGMAGVSNGRYIGRQRVIDAGEVFQRYAAPGSQLEKLLSDWEGWSSRQYVSTAESEVWSMRGVQTGDGPDTKAVLTEMMFMPKRFMGLTQGLHVLALTANGVDEGPSTDGFILDWEPLRWPFDFPVRDDAVEITNSKYYYGDVNTRLIGGLNRGLNKMYSDMVHAAGRASKTVAIGTGVDTGEGAAPTKIEQISDDDTLILIPGDQARIQSLNMSGQNASLQASLLPQFLLAINATTGSAIALPPGSVPDQQAIVMAEVAAMKRLRDAMGRALTGSALMAVRRCQRWLSVNDLTTIMKDKNPAQCRLFKDAELRYDTSVDLKQSGYFLGNLDALLKFVAMLAQGGNIIEKYIDPDQITAAINLRELSGPTARDGSIKRARAENAMLRFGPITRKTKGGKTIVLPFEGVLPTDNHMAHIPIHGEVLENPNREMLSEDHLDRVLLHNMQHMKFLQDAAQQQQAQTIQAEKIAAVKNAVAQGQPAPAPGQAAPGPQ
jgi:hypothetical protein